MPQGARIEPRSPGNLAQADAVRPRPARELAAALGDEELL